ncbi:glycoside hydrolase [Acidianus sp. HS-5]|uniref:glycoside hydrolase n=1 Tax=Acidianus sp. HS-5 TaxID=2886040 RepID=UPI001F26C1A4|nr:glycoside hydrolase [Acidianus sp. HS-5]BDC18685.1 glycoside hydrolase [Acidianus sp. HS-5]
MTKKIKTRAMIFFIVLLFLIPHYYYYFSYASSKNCYINPYYPSYLLLNNWRNLTVWIPTGIQVINRELDGFPLYNASIRNIALEDKGILNLIVCLGVKTKEAYLQLNNTVLIKCNNTVCIVLPPYTWYLLLLVNVKTPFNVTIESNSNWTSQANYYRNNITWLATNSTVITMKTTAIISFQERGMYYVELSLFTAPCNNISHLTTLNNNEVKSWLSKSEIPKYLPKSLLSEYYLSLLVIKDDQNPYLGNFAASPSPVYLYSWVRDSSFAAIALQESGHYSSALKYWLWMANATCMYNGTWYTRYNFYDGKPCIGFGIPELDSLGIFEMGIYNFYNLTHNTSFINEIKPRLCKIIRFQTYEVLKNKFHLIPEDLSVWEDRLAYHFWTEAFNDLGLYYMEKLGFNVSYEEKLLNMNIIQHFWRNGYFVSALGQSVLYEESGAVIVLCPMPPDIDSSTLLPLDMGYLPLNSNYSEQDLKAVVSNLTVNGGLSRFSDDLYHYSQDLYDSCEQSPPWVITTMFEALYYARIGELNSSIKLLCWAYNHSQQGLLPEAIAPVKGYPLPTTSPLTWSSAMFVIVSLNLHEQKEQIEKTTTTINNANEYIIPSIITLVILLAIVIIYRKIILHSRHS